MYVIGDGGRKRGEKMGGGGWKRGRDLLAPVGPAGNRFDNESATGTVPVLNIFSSSASCSNLSKSACSSSSSIGSVIGIDVIALPIS